ncbi:MAG: metallopeptidase TldD-related protein [Bdellovibrionota bacterium]
MSLDGNVQTDYTQKLFQNFKSIQGVLFGALQSDETLSLTLNAEDTDFIRWNHGLIRQNTAVEQAQLGMTLMKGNKTHNSTIPFYLDQTELRKRALLALGMMRDQLNHIPEDPYQHSISNEGQSEEWTGTTGNVAEKVTDIRAAAEKHDTVGILCSGPVISATANSLGTFHWYCSHNFYFDYSIFNGHQAATNLYAGQKWNHEQFNLGFQETAASLKNLDRPRIDVKPGEYRTYIAPAGVYELLDMMNWSSFSHSALLQGPHPLKRLSEGKASLHPSITLRENFNLGLAPRFNAEGKLSEPVVDMIKEGQFKSLLVNDKTHKEYNLPSNAANEGENPRSLEMLGGNLKHADILKKLDTGLYLSNLHYLNWSDPESARFTGMTRYACFWVEKGQIKGPIQDLRFDESLYTIFGSALEALTEETVVSPYTLTYERRHLQGKKNPGLLTNSMRFTL